ncbi:MAG: helix-turn-helix domain-containing protein [Polyangiales bacterium]
MSDEIHDDSGRWLFNELLRRGVPAAKLFEDAGLSAAHRRGELRPPWSARVAVTTAASKLLDDPCLGFDLAGHIAVEQQGMFAAALVHAHSLREMFEIARAHLTLWEPTAQLSVESNGASTRLHYAHQTGDPLGDTIETQLSLSVMTAILVERIPAARSSLTLGFACAPPTHERCASTVVRLGVATRFHQSRWYAELPTAFVDEKLAGAHPVVRKLLHERLEQEHHRKKSQRTFLDQLRAALREGLERRWSAEDIAAACELSTRTLQHRLQAHGTSLTEQQALVRIERARALLEDRELTIEAVADRVGFDSLAAFSRFFRKHTGVAPSAYRAERSSR